MCLHLNKKQRIARRLQLSGICCWTKSRISSDKQKCQIKVFQNEFWKVASPISVKTSWIANWKVFLNPFLKFLDSDNFDQFNEISFPCQNKSIDMQLDWTGKSNKAKLINGYSQSVFEMRNTLLSQNPRHNAKKIFFLHRYMWIDYCIVMLPHGRFTVYRHH